jgi:hypothetical protein
MQAGTTKQFTEQEFEILVNCGSPLVTVMICNSVVLEHANKTEVADCVDWLEVNATANYYVSEDNQKVRLYFSAPSDRVTFMNVVTQAPQ